MPDRLILQPGTPAITAVEVSNTLPVIDGLTAAVVPVDGLATSVTPALLPLFPDASGTLDLELVAGPHFPAGTHQVVVQVRSSVDPDQRLDLVLSVEVVPAPAVTLAVEPPARRAHHRASYRLVCTNEGNTVLDVGLASQDPAKGVAAKVVPDVLSIAPGQVAYSELRVKARRHLLGNERRHQLTVLAGAGDQEAEALAAFRQPPVLSPGARTAAVLVAIVALWAGVFLVALKKANSSDPLTKDVPPSFYAAIASSQPVNASAFGALGHPGLLASASSGDIPAGAVPKTGVVIGVGGTIDGTLVAQSTGSGIGRITVQAWRQSPTGPQLVASAATGSDGSYSIVGLLPGDYEIEFSATGYQTVWYPSAPDQTEATPVAVAAQADTNGVNATIDGLAGSISGTVDTGQTPSPPVTVTVTAEQGSGHVIATTTTNSSGGYIVSGLPAPGTYDLSFSAAGYQVASDSEEIAGGEAHIASTVTLSAADGTIGGTVTDGKNPLGGVVIVANAGGQTVTSATPTSGPVGQFSIPNLPTPATYLLTFSDQGYGSDTIAQFLGPGQSITNLHVTLAGGAGQISGEVTTSTGTPLGGAAVTVDNLNPKATTTTLTAGSIGSYLLSGLPTPGTYTITFSLSGYQPETTSVTLASSGSATDVSVQLPPDQGSISGTVTSSSGAPLSGVAVAITDGTTVENTTTTSSPSGGFSLGGLAPGSYSVTFSLTGYNNTTVLVHLNPGQAATASATLTPVSST